MNVQLAPFGGRTPVRFGGFGGFDSLFNLFDDIAQPIQASYPQYNIERTDENQYRISVAVAGFNEDELNVEAKQNSLVISGNHKEEKKSEDNKGSEILFHGIASKNFQRRFQLADNVEVQDASLQNGMLYIDLIKNVPEELETRKININTA